MRVLRRLVPIILVVALVVALLLVFTARPDIRDARTNVNTSWDAAAPALDTRFGLLATANNTVKGTPGPVGEVAKEVDASLQDWLKARASKNRDRSIAVANELEGLGRRLVLVVRASPRVSVDPKVTGPVDAYANAAQPAELGAFATAAKAYADEREGPVHALVAQMFGYDAVPSVAVPPPAT
jgi:hypothetical protein